MMTSTIFLSLLLALLPCVQSEITLIQPEAETGHPGGSLSLTCKTRGFNLGSSSMYWIRQVPGQGLEWIVYYYSSSMNNYAPAIKDRFTAAKDTSNNIFALEMRSVKIDDTAIYYCTRRMSGYEYLGGHSGYWGQGTMVTVTTATPSSPTLYGLVSSCQQGNIDGSVIYGCLAMDYSPDVASVTWKKHGQLITTGVQTYPSVRNKKGTYTLSSQLALIESDAECDQISCEVRHSGSDKSTGMPCPDGFPTALLTVSSSEEIESRKFAIIVCSISDFHSKSISVTWLKNGRSVDSGIFTSPVCEANGNFSVTSRLRVPYAEWFDRAVYTCQVKYKEVIQSWNITGPQVSECHGYTAKILPPPVEQVLLEATVTLTCVVSNLHSGVNFTWLQDEKTLKSEIAHDSGEHSDGAISKLDISTEAWLSEVVFECVVNHQYLPTPLRDSIHKERIENPLEPSVSVLLPTTEELSAQRFLSLTCLVRGFRPREIFVKWTTNDKPVNPSNYKNTEVTAESDNTSFFLYSLLSIAAEEWASGASYSCVVGHEAIPLKIINRTVDKSSGKPSFVNISLALMDTINSCQ
nr:Ig heavy chain - nurse shark [Ginglymostoma cirratum]AAA50817.1 immunoglobulin heavy chain [Ginglymostoma cirratum]